jgi:uncharacterized LabA/DUF88 family protein
MHFYQHERVALFIDGANTHHAIRALGFGIDYKRLLGLFRSKCNLVRAYYFTAVHDDDSEPSTIRPLVDWLDYNGFTMMTKPMKSFTDADGYRKVKGNMDVDIAVSAMQLADEIDHVVLFSGDGDFASLVAALQEKAKRVTVISTIETKPPMLADELRRQADQFIDLASLESEIARELAPVRATPRNSPADR